LKGRKSQLVLLGVDTNEGTLTEGSIERRNNGRGRTRRGKKRPSLNSYGRVQKDEGDKSKNSKTRGRERESPKRRRRTEFQAVAVQSRLRKKYPHVEAQSSGRSL